MKKQSLLQYMFFVVFVVVVFFFIKFQCCSIGFVYSSVKFSVFCALGEIQISKMADPKWTPFRNHDLIFAVASYGEGTESVLTWTQKIIEENRLIKLVRIERGFTISLK